MKGSKPVPAWADKCQITRLGYKAIRMLKNEGLSHTVFATKYVIRRSIKLKKLKKEFYLTPEQRAEQQAHAFNNAPTISLLTPLFNTDERYLRDLIESVMAQSYPKWELCLGDASDADHAYVGEIAREYASRDSRIVYKNLKGNFGIAGNVNACIEMSSGDFIARLDHDDLLAQSALYEMALRIDSTGCDMVYSDEAIFNITPADCSSMHFKPCWSPDFMRGCNYICHLFAVRRTLADEAGLYDNAYNGSEDYDFTLRVAEKTQKPIEHIAKPLYYWRVHEGSVAADISEKPYAYDAARRAVQSHIDRIGLAGKVVYSRAVPMMRVIYDIPAPHPLVSIIIPSCDHADVLRRCINSIYEKSTYDNFEIIICENNSSEQATFDYYDELKAANRAKIVTWSGIGFNYSAVNNFARKSAAGTHLLFLNNDIEVITPEWLEEMVMFTQRHDVGACGAKLLYPNDTVQHGGIAVGIGGSAANLCQLYPRDNDGYLSRLAIASNMSACTGACLMVRADVFDEVGGFEEALAVSFNDVDLCLKIRQKGYLIVFNPVAECYHHESLSRGYDKSGAKKQRMEREKTLLRERWPQYYEGEGDPYYNPNFGRNSVDYDA